MRSGSIVYYPIHGPLTLITDGHPPHLIVRSLMNERTWSIHMGRYYRLRLIRWQRFQRTLSNLLIACVNGVPIRPIFSLCSAHFFGIWASFITTKCKSIFSIMDNRFLLKNWTLLAFVHNLIKRLEYSSLTWSMKSRASKRSNIAIKTRSRKAYKQSSVIVEHSQIRLMICCAASGWGWGLVLRRCCMHTGPAYMSMRRNKHTR
jgi:hypothetical protein